MSNKLPINKIITDLVDNFEIIETVRQTVVTQPLKSGCASFRTHKLTKENSGRLVFRPTTFAIIFCSLFIFIGLGLLYFGYSKYQNNETEYLLFIAGFIFFIAGSIILKVIYIPRVFDKHLNMYYKGLSANQNNSVSLSKIVALQIIGEHVQSDDSSYQSFEINLVLDDASQKTLLTMAT